MIPKFSAIILHIPRGFPPRRRKLLNNGDDANANSSSCRKAANQQVYVSGLIWFVWGVNQLTLLFAI